MASQDGDRPDYDASLRVSPPLPTAYCQLLGFQETVPSRLAKMGERP